MISAINNIEYLGSKYPKPTLKSPTPPDFKLKLARLGFNTLGRLFPKTAGNLLFKGFTTPRIRARHKRSDALLEQAQVFEVLYGDRILKGYEWGTGKDIVLLVHGWESRGTALRSFVPNLLEKGFKVVAMDGPAHGDSEGKRTTLSDFGGAIVAMIRHLDGVHSIICHSFGGPSTAFGLNELTDDIHIKNLVLIGVPNSVKVPFNQVVKTLQVPSKVAEEFRGHLSRLVKHPLEEFSINNYKDTFPVEKVLVVHDKLDEGVPFHNGKDIVANWEKATLLVTDGYGHFIVMKNPDVIEKVADFIA